jgi:hypothetical protein
VQLTNSLAELVQEHVDDHSLATIGDIEVYLVRDDNLRTGVFGVASRMEPQAPPRRRPFDSMSMPVVAGRPSEYVQPLPVAPRPGAPRSATGPSEPAQSDPRLSEPAGPATAVDHPAPYRDDSPAEPARRPMYRGYLIVDGTPRSLELKRGSNIVGRSSESDLQLIDQGVSRRHLDVHVAEARAVAYDLGSTNGTTVNGHGVQSQELQHGDVIRVGHTRLVYHQETG